MNQRKFLAAGALGATALPSLAQASGGRQAGRGPSLLTVTGAVGRGNRGPFDPALDQTMQKQKISLGKAHAFDFAALVSLPAFSIQPTLQYDAKPHALSELFLAGI